MCEKLQTISMKYNDFLNKDSYCWEVPWKLYKWNPGYSRKGETCVVAFHVCEKFQMIFKRYDAFLNEDSYYREGPWKLYKWNLGDCAKE